MEPYNYASVLRAGQSLVPDYAADEARGRLLSLQEQQLGAQLEAAKIENDAARGFQNDLDNVLLNPGPKAYSELILKHPKYAQQIKGAWGMLDEAKRTADLRQMGEVYSAAANGKYDIAAKSLRTRIDADKAADGAADPQDEAVLSALESGDPVQQKAALAQLGIIISSITGPEQFSATLGALTKGKPEAYTLSPGAKRFDDGNNLVAEAPFAPELRSVGPGDTLVEVQPGGGGQTSSGGAAGFDAIDGGFVAPQEGGYAASDGASGAPVNFGINQKANPDVDVKNLTAEQAKRIRRDRYWTPSGAEQLSGPLQAIHYDTAINMGVGAAKDILKQSSGDPAKYMEIREARHSKMKGPQEAWSRRNGELRQFAGLNGQGGGARVIAQGAPKPGYQMLTPAEVSAIPNLDPGKAYQRSPDGQITAIGGTDRGSLKAWPATALNVRSTNGAALKNIKGAIDLIKPENKSEAAKIARNSIGFGTGAFGDAFTQWNDPKGTDARARIGQIGGLIIKDTSGAAVSLSEDVRLAKWVPLTTDNADVALAKLRNLERELAQRNQSMDETYTEEQGYRPFQSATAPARVRSVQEAMKLPKGTVFTTPDGRRKVR